MLPPVIIAVGPFLLTHTQQFLAGFSMVVTKHYC